MGNGIPPYFGLIIGLMKIHRWYGPSIFSLEFEREERTGVLREVLMDNRWIQDINGDFSVATLSGFLGHRWRLVESGQYSAKLAYMAFFNGAIYFEPWELIWKS